MNRLRLGIFPTRAPAKQKSVGVIDLETDGFGGDLIAGAYQTESMESPVIFTDLADWFDYAESVAPDVIWYAHNAAGFDLKYLLTDQAYLQRAADGWETTLVCSGQQIVLGVKMEWHEQHREGGKHRRKLRIDVRDSMKLAPMSLQKFTHTFAPEHEKLTGHIDFEAGERFDLNNPAHVAYLNQDVTGLLAALVAFRGLIKDTFGVQVGWTLPATAYRAWQATLDTPVFQTPPWLRDFCRRAYYGGMVRPGMLKAHNATHLDRNSAYPTIMKEDLPIGGAFSTGSKYIEGLPGIYKIVAIVPKGTALTILPKRTKEGVTFPTGSFETWCTSCEIDLAMELGHTVMIVEGYAWSTSKPICKQFVEKCEQLRQQDYSGPIGIIAKLIQNSLYGKFGTKDQTQTFSYGSCPSPESRQISTPGSVLPLWSRDDTRNVAQIQPHIAAWITARQRVDLARAILATGADRFVYCDTDSLVTTADNAEQLLAVGGEYGQWKVEARGAEIRVAAPKTYAERAPGQSDKIVAKGLPVKRLTFDMIEQATEGSSQHVEFLSSVGLVTVLKGDRTTFFRQTQRALPTPESSLGWSIVYTDHGEARYRPVDEDDLADAEVEKYEQAVMRQLKIGPKYSRPHSWDKAELERREDLWRRLHPS